MALCQQCETGTYNDVEHATKCRTCDSGYTREKAATGEDQCAMDPSTKTEIIIGCCAGGFVIFFMGFGLCFVR